MASRKRGGKIEQAENNALGHDFSFPADRPKTRCVKCTPMCASARVAPSNIVYQRYGYRSTGTGVLTTKVLLLR